MLIYFSINLVRSRKVWRRAKLEWTIICVGGNTWTIYVGFKLVPKLDLWISKYGTVYDLTTFSQTVEHDTKGSSNATETGTKETSHDPEGEEESVTLEEAKKGEARDGRKHIPASPAVSPRPGSTKEYQIVLTTVIRHLTRTNLLGIHWWFTNRTALWFGVSDIQRQSCCVHWFNMTWKIFLSVHGLSQPQCVSCQSLIFISYDFSNLIM